LSSHRTSNPPKCYGILRTEINPTLTDAILNGGVGEHQQYVAATHPERLQHWFKELWALSWIYNFAATLPKLAILFFYYRLFGTANKFARYNIFILATILSLYTIILTVLEFCTCAPIAANWNPNIPGARCWNKRIFASWITVPNFLTDIWMMILPIPIIWKLVAPKRLKIGLTFTFLVGSMYIPLSSLPLSQIQNVKLTSKKWTCSVNRPLHHDHRN
jgi:hypothetical protein